MKQAIKYVAKKRRMLQIEQNTIYRKYKKIRTHVSGCSSDQSTQLEYLSHLASHYSSRGQKTATPSGVGYMK
jgi:hypothetical protein